MKLTAIATTSPIVATPLGRADAVYADADGCAHALQYPVLAGHPPSGPLTEWGKKPPSLCAELTLDTAGPNQNMRMWRNW